MPTSEEQRKRRRERRRQLRAQALAAAATSGQRRILRIAELEAVTGKGRSEIYDEINDGVFPEPVPLGERAVGWLSDEVDLWLAGRIAERNASKQREAEPA
jgi:prophage regulatory protein